MGVYVDNACRSFRRMKMCHMIADTPQELHEMARRIGMCRGWYQHPGITRFPHYDVAKGRRNAAIGFGAQILDRREFVDKMKTVSALMAADPEFRESWNG